MNTRPDCIWPVAAELGEGPVWSRAAKVLWFVDIEGQQVHRFDPATTERRSFVMPDRPGFALPCAGGALVVGMSRALHCFDPVTQDLQYLVDVEPDRPGNRLNDASVDPRGRLWFGSMDDAHVAPSGALYCWHRGVLSRHDDGIRITNGPAVSPNGRTLYHTDTLGGEIHAFDLDDEGVPHRKRVFLQFDVGQGWPDGTTVDAEGCLWVAFFGGWAVRRYAPDGRLLLTVRMPCANVTKLAFGGPDLRTAYVTSAWTGLGPHERAEQPLAGGLFAFAAPVAGLSPTELELDHV